MTQEINAAVKSTWNANAQFWDEYMGEQGNSWHRVLIDPAMEHLLDLKPEEEVLEIACGNGRYSRAMARMGVRVTATDFSDEMIRIAKARDTEHGERVEYRILDAMDREALLSLGSNRFDAAVSSMALFDIADIEPLVNTLGALLKKGGRFVFAIMHPCFNSGRVTRIIESQERDGETVTEYGVKMLSYHTPVTTIGNAVSGQPEPHRSFHRTISTYFNTCFRAGFALDGVEEPVFGGEAGEGGARDIFRDIPPVLVARMRLINSHG